MSLCQKQFMNLTKYLFTLTTLLSVIFASPFPLDDEGICQLTDADYNHLDWILNNDVDADKTILAMVGEGRLGGPDHRKMEFLTSLMKLHKFDLFEFFAERHQIKGDTTGLILQNAILNGVYDQAEIRLEPSKFNNPEERDNTLSVILISAITSKNLDACNFVLSQDFKFNQCPTYHIKHTDLSLDEMKQLISSHPDKAADISPKSIHFTHFWDEEETVYMIDFARHCAEVSQGTSNPIRFEPTKVLEAVIENHRLKDCDRAMIVSRLCELGADVNQKMSKDSSTTIVDYLRDHDYPESYEVAMDYQMRHQ